LLDAHAARLCLRLQGGFSFWRKFQCQRHANRFLLFPA
jgi:hypothetical protein